MVTFERTYVSVNLDAVRHNIEHMKANLKDGTKMCAIVKTDGYGHGAVPVARAIEDLVWGYGVATIEEAMNLREHGITAPILILGVVPESAFELLVEHEIRYSDFQLEKVEKLAQIAVRLGKKAYVHVKVDTGMSRLGVTANDALALTRRIHRMEGINLEGIFTHLATADMKDNHRALQQIQIFRELIDRLLAEGIKVPICHCDNSAAILELPDECIDMVRPGISMYGMYPSDEVERDQVKLEPVLEWKTRIVYAKWIEAGTAVGYGATYVADKRMRIATIPVGYGDGYPRMLSGKGFVLIQGQKAPIIGRICMDQLMADITHIAGADEGDSVTLIGRDGDNCICVEDLAEEGVFHYEFVCGIGRRVPRVYIKEGNCIGTKTWFHDRYEDFVKI